MKSEAVGGIAGFVGRRIGRVLSDRARRPVVEGVHAVRGLSGPVVRAFVDGFLAERIVTATWPSIAVLVAVISIHGLSLVTMSGEPARVLIGLVVFAALGFSAYGVLRGALVMLPHARVWFVARLAPVPHARLLLFQWLRGQINEALARPEAADFTEGVVAAALAEFQQTHRLGANELAFVLADDLAPVLVRHLLRRLVVLLGPLVGAFLYYRLAIYPDIIARYTTIGPWGIAAYPFAAAADILLQTHWRALLQGS
jgi:hypothetical protein